MKIQPKLIDSHCHFDDPQLDFEVAVRVARAAGVDGAVIPGYGPERWARQSELLLSRGDFALWGGFGIHPWVLEPSTSSEAYRDMLAQGWVQYARRWGERLVAVGEFGLDRSKTRGGTLELQRSVFSHHLDLARTAGLPVILHLVRSDGLALELLRELPPPRGGVIHAFSSQPETVPAYAELGLSFGFGAGLLRFSKVREALRAVGSDRFMFETDDPKDRYNLREILEAASQVLGKSVEYLRKQHSENCARVFRL